MNQKKMLLITPDFPPMEGGVARYLSELATFFKDDIEVLTVPNPAWQSSDPSAGYPVYRSPLLFKWIFPRWWKMVRILKSYQDRYRLILTSHVLPFGTAAMVAMKKTKTPYVVFVHGMDIRLAQQSARKRAMATQVLKYARVVVCNSQALAQEVAKVFGVTELLVVYPCLPTVPLPTKPASDGRFHLLTVSRLVKRKGHAHVLTALSLLRRQGLLENFVYDIAGEGPEEGTLKEMVSELGLQDSVRFHGRVDRTTKSQLYAVADVFVMPVSNDPVDKEGFGLVFLEAAQYAVPSITTNVTGVTEAVVDRETGIVLRDQDEQHLAQEILELSRNAELRIKLGLAAYDHAAKFTCEEQFRKLKAYLLPTTSSLQPMPLGISVIIPTYQHGKTITACLDSLLAQTRRPDEIIVVNNGSTDDTRSRLEPYLDRIVYLDFQENQGAPAARMAGFGRSTGSLLFFCDADVVAEPTMLETLEQALSAHPEASYAYSSFFWGHRWFASHAFDANALRKNNYINTMSLIRREHFPGFDPSLKRFQDWDLWLTMLEQGHTGVFVDAFLFTVQQDGGRRGISTWLPSFMYRIPWKRIGWTPRAIKDYRSAREIIVVKHKL
ncbi:glycosyltransferase [Candidatus Uhrbacteria bacterium]|nr:glycosyltransferase [Candidatus Uhrbacteria bacterium]